MICEDRISRLPDELIHKILSYLDAKVAVQTSVLSKQWKLTWKTLPFINIGEYKHSSPKNKYSFISHIFFMRNNQSHISKLKLCIYEYSPPDFLLEKLVKYAISHSVQDLHLELHYRHRPFKLSTLTSKTLKKLTLRVNLKEFVSESDFWDLPALTYLRLVLPRLVHPLVLNMDLQKRKLPELCLTCLPALRTLFLDYWDISESSFSFSLPGLTTLRLFRCHRIPRKIWNFPALLSLELDLSDTPENMSDIISALVNLKELTIVLTRPIMEQFHSISCLQLLNLNISILRSDSLYGNIKVLAPKLCIFNSVGIFSISLEAPELENVNIKLRGWFGTMEWIYRKQYYRLFTDMLSGLGSAKILTFDLGSIEALSAMDFLATLPSPFYNLKILKLTLGYEESSISSVLRSYLLGGSPGATLVKRLYRNNVKHHAVPVVSLNEPLATPSTVNSVVHQVGTSCDGASSSRGNSDFGHKVNSEFVSLLDLIAEKYPETFEHFTAKSERFYTMKLNVLCTSVTEFLKTSMPEFNTDVITEYRDLFVDLQRWGFNVNWLVNHLNYIQQLRFSQHELHAIVSLTDEDAKTKLEDLRTHCLKKITVEKASG